MKKLKMKKKTMATFLVIASVIAGASLTAIIDSKSGVVSDLFEERNCSKFSYIYEQALCNGLIDFDVEDKTISKKVDISSDSPYEYVTYKFTKYSDDSMYVYYDDELDALSLDSVSKVELTFKLKQNVDFYVNNIYLNCNYLDEGYDNYGDNELKVTAKVGRKSFNICDTSHQDLFFSQNSYSDDLTITIVNTRALKNEPSVFTISSLYFNWFAKSSYSGVSGE